MLKKLYQQVVSLVSYLYAFYRSPEYREWCSGTRRGLNEAIWAYNKRMDAEFEAVMTDLNRKRWALGERYRLKAEQCRRMEGALKRKGEELLRLQRERGLLEAEKEELS